MEKEEAIRQIVLSYYSRKDIQEVLYNFSKQREVVPRYFEGFGKRPDNFQYPSDVIEFAKKGATSFHASEELWKDPLQIPKDSKKEKLDELRQGWDFLIDIDSKYLDYSKIVANLLIRALEFHRIKNIGIKFSGSKGFHIIIPWKAFPKQVANQETKNMFPEWPRMILQYLTKIIEPKLIEGVTNLYASKVNMGSYIKDFEAPKQVMPDLILVSSRHLFRMPYSLHEKTRLASIVLDKKQIDDFQPRHADPLKVKPVNFLPDSIEGEAQELLIQALDWYKDHKDEVEKQKNKKSGQYKEVIIKNLTADLFPPCILKILNGLEDGKKRALFILINFFRSLNLSIEEIEQKITEWNKKNKPPLREGYIRSQLDWNSRQKIMLPPNCDKDYYKGIGVCEPDELCSKIKNPVNYVVRKSFRGKKKITKNNK